jgi:hypothetical protein
MFTGRGEDEEMENKGEQRKDELVKDRMEPEKDREGWTPGEDEEMENKGEQRKDELVKDRMEPEKDREGWTPCQVIH